MPQELRISKAADFLGMSVAELRRLEREGFLKPDRTEGGHRRYSLRSLKRLAKVLKKHRQILDGVSIS